MPAALAGLESTRALFDVGALLMDRRDHLGHDVRGGSRAGSRPNIEFNGPYVATIEFNVRGRSTSKLASQGATSRTSL